MPVTYISQDNFTTCYEDGYLSRYADLEKNYEISQAPEDLELISLKLHISLSKEAYPVIKNKVISLLENAVHSGMLKLFKYTNEDYVMETLQQEYDAIQKLAQLTSEDDLISYDANTLMEFATVLSTMVGKDLVRELLQSSNEEFLSKLKEVQESAAESYSNQWRLLNGAQFTIYIPIHYKKENLLNICAQIENVLSNSEVGEFTDEESQVSTHFSLRDCYYLEEDKESKSYISRYISAIGDEDEAVRKYLKEILEQNTDGPYLYLKTNLKANSSTMQDSLPFMLFKGLRKLKLENYPEVEQRMECV